MKYAQRILTQRIEEIQKYKAEFPKHSADYQKLDIMDFNKKKDVRDK